MVSGAYSKDRVVPQGERFDSAIDAEAEEESINLASINTYTGYNRDAAAAYAVTWCGTAVSNNPQSPPVPANYNPLYYYVYGYDCANFVSQCIFAGGVSELPAWYAIRNTGATTPQPAIQGIGAGSIAWVSVSDFDVFWRNQGISRVSATVSTTFKGNPVYYLTSSSGYPRHLMICNGYVSGVPVLAGHNSDMYNVPITNYIGSFTLYTLTFACEHIWVPYQLNERCSRCGLIRASYGLSMGAEE